MRKIITYGTFDLLHIGHINILRRAKEMGDVLIVGLSTDNFNNSKGKTSAQSYKERYTALSRIEFIDKIIKEETWEQKTSDIKKYNIDCFVIGDDWTNQFDELKEFCEVEYLARTKGISSTLLRNLI